MTQAEGLPLAVVLAQLIEAAHEHVGCEIRAMERIVARLEERDRLSVENRWPEGERWRGLASDEFCRLADATTALYQGRIVLAADQSKVFVLG